jgi:hypothetical protein
MILGADQNVTVIVPAGRSITIQTIATPSTGTIGTQP